MASIVAERLVLKLPVFGASARSLKNLMFSHATGGRIMPQAGEKIVVQALNDLSFQARDGDRIGLLGHNGSGKTSLLRVLAGISPLASGRLTIDGRVSALLNTTAGMAMDATGLQNIYLRGLMMGMSRKEIGAKEDEIAEFTELGKFLALPVRTYSAGMFARLAFGISTAMNAEILLLDEVMGAGDDEFQEKARQRIDGLLSTTPIIFLASHSEGMIKTYCNRVIKLDHGRKVEDRRLAGPIGNKATTHAD